MGDARLVIDYVGVVVFSSLLPFGGTGGYAFFQVYIV